MIGIRKKISILGASGSVGTQALDVAMSRGYEIDILSASVSVDKMEAAVRRHTPRFVYMESSRAAADLKIKIADTRAKVVDGITLSHLIKNYSDSDTVVNAISGHSGLAPTLAVIDRGTRLALANKESLVIAGEIVTKRARDAGVEILPVDSEHSAIFQSLRAGKREEISKILLTASGGPFFGKKREELRFVTKEQVLSHPTWRMGNKITVDSATLMNKGFEVIEACYLFDVSPEKIKVLIHRESILHSAVEYIDKAVIGQMSVPDMRECVQYAIDYPERFESAIEALDLFKIGSLTFAEPDYSAFPLLPLAFRAMADGGAYGAVIEAADERAVEAFLSDKITFGDISDIVSEVYSRASFAAGASTLDEILESHSEAARIAAEIIGKKLKN